MYMSAYVFLLLCDGDTSKVLDHFVLTTVFGEFKRSRLVLDCPRTHAHAMVFVSKRHAAVTSHAHTHT